MSKYFTVKEVISGLPEEKVPHRLLIDTVNEKLIYDLDEDTRIDLSNASELLKKQDKFAEITTDVDNGAIETIFLGKTDLMAQNCVQVENVADPIKDNDAVNKSYVDNKIPSGLSLIDIHGYYPDGVEEPVRVDVNFSKQAKINIPTLDVNIENQITITAPNGVHIKSDINSDSELILDESAGVLSINSSKVSLIENAAGINVEGSSGSHTGHAIAIAPYVTDDIINDNDVPLFDSQADGSSAVLVSSNESRIRLYADYIDLGKSYPEIDLKNGVVSNVNTILGKEDIGLSINYLHEPELSHQAATKNYVDKSLPIISADEPMPEEGRIWLQPITTNAGAVDYIVDEGVSGIWTYRKWNSGIAECWGIGTVSVTCTNEKGVYYSDPKSIALPSNLFNGDSAASATLADPFCWVTNVVASTSAVSFRVIRGESYSNTFSPRVSLFVKGKWK